MTTKSIRLTAKEIRRASNGVTIIARPAGNGGCNVLAVYVTFQGYGVPVGDTFTQKNVASIAASVKDINRWLDKLAYPVPMADASRHRRKPKVAPRGANG